ncbi:diablo, IAP-binding mitochondrial protein a isoform X1 [Hypomesus transpacificus]|uniref:diablo, IAP-binding mitochondrial protein a isoform X1 n=1 Tax=Hypomesus transpacificus TaxID=137520 RepID=UPI001F0727E0|nr:diablo, IAP-binding mitochondrial protein a isoform X1 [Hypomesus transpacificus]
MQAFRHCSICANGGVLHSRTDFLLQRTNMATLKRAVVCVNLFRNTASVLSSRKPSRHGLVRLTDVTRTSMVSLSVGSGLCAVPFTQQVENLSNESLVRKASLVVFDSANTYLSQTTLALVDSLTQYAKALHTLIALQKRYLASLGKLNAGQEDSIWQVIIGQRGEVSDRLEECNRFESNWMNAVNLCKMAAEAAYSTGAEHASITAKTNLQIAQSQVEDIRKLSQHAEKKLAETKADEIQRMAEYASYLERGYEEVPEAYLRED